MAEKKEKRYVSDNAQLMAEWNWEKNNVLNFQPETLTLGSNKKVWWMCSKGHEWQAMVSNRNKGRGCPYCSGKKVLKGYNDLQTICPNISEQWHPTKNSDLLPCNVTFGSEKKVWWKCDKGHEWQARIANRYNGQGCPYCSGRYAAKGVNDLQTVNPDLSKEWNYERNNGLTPADVMPNSGKKVWWKCIEGHEWQATIDNRNKGTGCPYCSGQKVLKGYNDLQAVNPILSKEWNYERNNGLTPMDVLPNSNKKVWWKCSKGHEWQTTINNRNNGNGCPVCTSERKTSFPEYAIAFYLEKYGLKVIHSYREQGYELDVYIPSKRIAIEYDGYFWHKNKTKKDLEKNQKCEKNGIRLYRIREELPSLNDSSIDYIVQKNQNDLPKILEDVLSEIIGVRINIDLKKDAIAIENLREYSEKESSILFSNPEIAKEWNYEKNGNLKPENFTPNSNKKVWWKCQKGHEWQSTIANRNIGNGCPFCSGKKVLIGYNDLKTINPTLANEWNYERNGNLKPEHFTSNSGEKVWWRCGKGHEWQERIVARNRGYGCPCCSGKKVLEGYNDLQTVNPMLAKEWNCEKNNGLTAKDVMPNSGKKVWWKCPKGHEWQATIIHRNKGSGCPYCSGRYAVKGENDLLTINPTLAREWNYERNSGLTPADVMPNSSKKVWWKCSKGHEWQAVVSNRNKGSGCPVCAKEKRNIHKKRYR